MKEKKTQKEREGGGKRKTDNKRKTQKNGIFFQVESFPPQSFPCLRSHVIPAGAPSCTKYQTHSACLMLLWKMLHFSEFLINYNKMKQEPTMCCLASGLEQGCLAAREQSGMPDLGKEEKSKRKKGMDKIICVLESHFKQGISCFCRECPINYCKKILPDSASESKGFEKSPSIPTVTELSPC